MRCNKFGFNWRELERIERKCESGEKQNCKEKMTLMLCYIAIMYEPLTINDGKARKFRDNK